MAFFKTGDGKITDIIKIDDLSDQQKKSIKKAVEEDQEKQVKKDRKN
jgi:hypothetical protein